jgi:hypothetical protein
MLLYRERKIGTTLYGCIVPDHHTGSTLDDPNTGYDSCSGAYPVVHPAAGELRNLKEGRARIKQVRDPVTYEELAALKVFSGSGIVSVSKRILARLAQ